MAYQTLVVEKRGAQATITLNRPQVLNAISTTVLKEIQRVLASLEGSPGVKVVLFRGAGDRAFSAGTDIKEVAGLFAKGRGSVLTKYLSATFGVVRRFPKPVVCAVHGYCLGAAVELMLSCDMVIAREDAQFGMPEIDRSIPSIVEAAILARAMSILRAKELVMTGDFWSAQRAERYGLVNEVVPRDKFEGRVSEVVNKLAAKDALALAVQKDICNKWLTTDLETAIEYSRMALLRTQGTAGQVQGMRSFVEKKR